MLFRSVGISQYELAKRSGISRTMIHHLESGKRNPTLITVHALASALALDLPSLMANAQQVIQSSTESQSELGPSAPR